MKRTALVLSLVIFCFSAEAQLFKKPFLSGMYLQWGYNRDRFSKSDLHFSDGNNYDFTIHNATAKDKPDFEGFRTNPIDITIPQNSYRIGFYLNKAQTHAIELNFDHAKYVMEDNKVRRISGQINGEYFDKDTLIAPWFVRFEHTNGANFYHINYVGQKELAHNAKRKLASTVWKAGAGVVIPKSDITLFGKRLDNKFHIAGYIISAEAGLRYYPFKNFFLEATVKGGYANYLNVLTVEGGKAHHHFYYAAVVGLIGLDIPLNKAKTKAGENKESVFQ